MAVRTVFVWVGGVQEQSRALIIAVIFYKWNA